MVFETYSNTTVRVTWPLIRRPGCHQIVRTLDAAHRSGPHHDVDRVPTTSCIPRASLSPAQRPAHPCTACTCETWSIWMPVISHLSYTACPKRQHPHDMAWQRAPRRPHVLHWPSVPLVLGQGVAMARVTAPACGTTCVPCSHCITLRPTSLHTRPEHTSNHQQSSKGSTLYQQMQMHISKRMCPSALVVPTRPCVDLRLPRLLNNTSLRTRLPLHPILHR